MTARTDRLNEVYVRLSTILQRPEVFGLDANVPQPLTDALQGIMRTLGQAIEQEKQTVVYDDLEQELSQDADLSVST